MQKFMTMDFPHIVVKVEWYLIRILLNKEISIEKYSFFTNSKINGLVIYRSLYIFLKNSFLNLLSLKIIALYVQLIELKDPLEVRLLSGQSMQ